MYSSTLVMSPSHQPIALSSVSTSYRASPGASASSSCASRPSRRAVGTSAFRLRTISASWVRASPSQVRSPASRASSRTSSISTDAAGSSHSRHAARAAWNLRCEAGLELDRTEQQPPRGAIRLARESAAAGPLERVGSLGTEIGRHLALQLREQRGSALEVVGLRLHELVRGPRLQPPRERPVEPRPLALREAAVGDVADQDVAEPERDLARDGRDRLPRQQLPLDEVGQRGVDIELGVELGDRASPEHATDEGPVAHDRPRRRGKPVDPGRDQRLHGVRDPHGRGLVALLGEHPDRLLDEERVPLRLVQERRPQAARQRRIRDERVDEERGVLLRKRPQVDRDRAASASSPPGSQLQELRAREADDQHRGIVHPVGEMLDEIEERLLRPVHVLEAEHERLRLGERRRPLLRGPGDLLPASAPRDGVEHPRGEPEQVRDGVARAGLPELLERLFRGVLGRDPRCVLDHLGQRPVGEPFSEGKRAPREHGRALEPREELADEPALADARIAEDRHELRPPVANGPRERVLQQVELLLPADVGRNDAHGAADRTLGADHAPHLHALAHASEGGPNPGLGHHAAGGQAVRSRPDQDLARIGRLLEPGRDVQRLAGRERRVTVLDDDLPRLDADPHRQLPVAGLDDGDGSAHRALGVVLVRRGDAEDRQHGVSCELLYRAAVRVDVRSDAVEEPRHLPPDDLRVARGDQGRGVDEIDEHRRRELALHTLSLGSAEGVRQGG